MNSVSRTTVNWPTMLAYGLVAVPLVLMFVLSPPALVNMGSDYVMPGGNPLQKVHPATLLATLSLVILFVNGRSRRIWSALFDKPQAIFYFVGLFALVIYAVAMLSGPFMALVDTFYAPGIFFLLLAALTLQEKRYIARLFDLLMIANSALGIFESVTNTRLVKLSIYSPMLGQYIWPHEFRSTSLLGHPLINSYVTVTYMLALILTNRISSPLMKYSILMLHFIALFAFGSRGGTVFLLVATVLYIVGNLASALRTGRISRDVLIYLGIGIPCVLLVAILVVNSGFADRFLDRFVHDNGSAESRSLGYDMLMSFPIGSLIVGPPADLTFQFMKRYGIVGIESCWLNMMLAYGIIGCALFFPALIQFCRCIKHAGASASYPLLLLFFACCTTSVSIASKNYGLTMTVVICMTSLDFKALARRGQPVSQSAVPARRGLAGALQPPRPAMPGLGAPGPAPAAFQGLPPPGQRRFT